MSLLIACGQSLVLVLAMLLASTGVATAQDRAVTPKVGILLAVDPFKGRGMQSFLDGMRELGWIDGETVKYVVRHPGGNPDRLAALAKELVAIGVDVIYAQDPAVPACRQATTRIPIVSPDMWDPVAQGYTSSLARPSTNVTGVSWQSVETAPKRLEIAKELIPGLKHVSLLYETGEPSAKLEIAALLAAARSAGVSLSTFGVRDLREVETAIGAIKRGRVGALIVSYHSVTSVLRREIASLATNIRLPTISEGRRFSEAGFLVTYGTDPYAADKHAAVFVDKLLKGAKPADLPFELAPKFELIVNLKTAKALGITIPESILVRADEVIR